MPRMSVIEATRRIKRILPDVIGVSTLDDTFIKESMRDAGSSHFVTKDCAHTLPDVVSSMTGCTLANESPYKDLLKSKGNSVS